MIRMASLIKAINFRGKPQASHFNGFTSYTVTINRAQLFETLFAFTVDQSKPGWDDSMLRAWLADHRIEYEILNQDT